MQPVKIIVCGDFRAAYPEKIKLSDEVADLFARADVRICNFEAPVHVEGVKPMKKSGPSLDQSLQSPSMLKKLGFNVVLMANNHIMDYGEAGLKATQNCFRDIITVGAGEAGEAFAVQNIEIAGKKIGLLSLVHREFGVVENTDDKQTGAAWICSPDVPGIIFRAKKEYDFLLVFPHAGIEHVAAPLPEWRKYYKRLVDWGADAVVASHPHCPQGFETYRGKPIYYSLGDFYFDELTYDDLWYKSIVVELTLGDTISVKEHYCCFNDQTGVISLDTSDRIRDYMNYVNKLLRDDKEYNEYIQGVCSKCWPGYKYGLLRGLCGVSLKMPPQHVFRLMGCMLLGNFDKMALLNAMQCESHRWLMEHYLKIK